MYTICYQLRNKRPQTFTFDSEIDMENHYNIWIAGDFFLYCDFFYDNKQYDPTWA